ncbi:unnamed protein product [Lymnaea stagnalis]|uniref:Uncharacterized protein n=1 Tax=Lymnaea stagnalis TaxID=6523 RepID=A0AAV2IFF8_LYMST
MAFRDTTTLWKIAFGIQIIGFILGLIAFSTNYLISMTELRNEIHAGLWKSCVNDECWSTKDFLASINKSIVWLDASIWMMSISVCAMFVTIIMTSLAFARQRTKLMGFCTAGVAGLAVLFGVIGVAVAGGESKRVFNSLHENAALKLDWSFTLFMIVQLVFFVAGGLHALDSRSNTQ